MNYIYILCDSSNERKKIQFLLSSGNLQFSFTHKLTFNNSLFLLFRRDITTLKVLFTADILSSHFRKKARAKTGAGSWVRLGVHHSIDELCATSSGMVILFFLSLVQEKKERKLVRNEGLLYSFEAVDSPLSGYSPVPHYILFFPNSPCPLSITILPGYFGAK